MISAELEGKIRRLFHAERWPVGTIARKLGLHHSAVRRALRRDGVPLDAIVTRRSKADPYVPFILETLGKYPDLSASRLYEMVRERGYNGGPDHFRAIVGRHRPKPAAEAYLRLSTLPGEQVQVDWGHFGHIEIHGARRPLVAFVMVLSWSRWMFLRFGVDMRMGSFLAHHDAALKSFDGVPRVALYDNLKSAVAERVGDAIVFNPTLLAFADHHRYEVRPCAPYRGNQKGRVERGIRDVRESFWPARTWTDLADLNAQAARWCREVRGARKHPEDRTLTVSQAFEEERAKLQAPRDDDYPVEDRVEVRIAKTPYARFDTNDYSVPHTRVCRSVTVLATPDIVRVLDGNAEIARHARCWGKGCVVEDPTHIAKLVEYKAKAQDSHGAVRLYTAVPVAQALVDAIAARGANLRVAIRGLNELLDAFGADALTVAISEVLASEAHHVAAVRQALDRHRQVRDLPPPVAVSLPDDPRVRNVVVPKRSLAAYDQLGRSKKGGDDG